MYASAISEEIIFKSNVYTVYNFTNVTSGVHLSTQLTFRQSFCTNCNKTLAITPY